MRAFGFLAFFLGATSALPAGAENRLDDGTGRKCLSPGVVIMRAHSRPLEAGHLSLTRCDGSPNEGVLPELSVLARPAGTERPSHESDVYSLDPGLLTRLQTLADRWPGRRIEIVSGYRPDARSGSRHRTGRALDIRIRGVSRRTVSEFARSLPNTGVGFYPNSLFTHIDVRDGQAYWIDESLPGEPPRYVRLDEDGEPLTESAEASKAEASEDETAGGAPVLAATPEPGGATTDETPEAPAAPTDLPIAKVDVDTRPVPEPSFEATAPSLPLPAGATDEAHDSILRVEGAVLAWSSHEGEGEEEESGATSSNGDPAESEPVTEAPLAAGADSTVDVEAPLPTGNLSRTQVERIRESALLALEALRESNLKDR